MIKTGGLKVFLFFILLTSLFAQQYRVGAGFSAGLPTDNTKAAAGFDVFVEYFSESLFSFRTGGGFSTTKFTDSNIYLDDVNYQLYWLEGTLTYYPLRTNEFVPYIGAGVGYYMISQDDFNEVRTYLGNFQPQNFSSKFSYHAVTGFVIPVHQSIKIHLQGKYLLFKQNLVIQVEEFIDGEIRPSSIESDVDLSTFYITAGVIINI